MVVVEVDNLVERAAEDADADVEEERAELDVVKEHTREEMTMTAVVNRRPVTSSSNALLYCLLWML